MKKVVLICSAVAMCFAASAQNKLARPTRTAPSAAMERKQVIANEARPSTGNQSKPNLATARHGHTGGNSVQSVITLGTAANALTAIRTHNFVWADPTMQLVT